MTGEIDPRNLLVSDAEREHVGQLLQRAVGQGRLTIDEFDTRMTAAMAARTRADLNVLVVDLAQPTGLAAAAPVVPAKDEVKLVAGIGDLKRRGRWVVPPKVKVSGGVGSILLDFTDAELTSPVTTIEASVGMGDLLILVPPGASVDADEVHASIGDVSNKVPLSRPEAGVPHFVVAGVVRMGSIRIVYPRSWRFGPLTVHRPFRLTWGSST